jgi:TolA-binding protein
LVLDPAGAERHRFEGFLPADEFLGQLHLGLAHAAFAGERWGDAERGYRQAVEQFPGTEAAPEALYWAGVSRYKGNGDPAALKDTARLFKERYQGTNWAKKASVWE